MNSKKTIKNILLVLLVAVVGLVVYAAFNSSDSKKEQIRGSLTSMLSQGAALQETDVTLANAEILKILGSIQNIELEDDIFANPIFKELKQTDFSIPKPVRIGRKNPFSPIGYDTSSSTVANSRSYDDINRYNSQNNQDSNNFFEENTSSQGSLDEMQNLDILSNE